MKKIIGNNEKEKNKIYWDNFYRNVNIQEESPFCKFIKSYNSENVFILDIGCGSGRDTFAFAKEGYNVVGIDRSEEAIKSNNLLKEKMDNISENIEFKVIDISNKKEFGQLIQKLSNKAEFQKLNFMIYTRFFIHAIDEEAEKILLSTISEY